MNPAVLLLEDNPDHAWLTMRTIQKNSSGENMIHFYSGDDFFDFLNTQLNVLPKLIFIDMHMPGMGGMQALRKLKRDPRYATVPVIMLTSSKKESDITESYAIGAAGYVVKPMDDTKFKEVIINLDFHTAGNTTLQ